MKLTNSTAPETEPSLECDHCGDVAIYGDKKGMFTDGAGGACVSCGFPGQVSCDAETEPYWMTGDDDADRCNRGDCEDCKDAAARLAPATPHSPEAATDDAEVKSGRWFCPSCHDFQSGKRCDHCGLPPPSPSSPERHMRETTTASRHRII